MSNWHIQVTIPEFKTHVRMSEKRVAKFYKRTALASIPEHIKSEIGTTYRFGSDKILRDSKGVKVIANNRSIGTPNDWKINGQSIVTGMHHEARAHIFKRMKTYLKEYVVKQVPVIPDEPIVIWLEYHAPIGIGNWDLDNASWLWFKWFNDSLVENKKLSGDTINNIVCTNCTEFIPVEREEDRKLIFHIQPYRTTRTTWKMFIERLKMMLNKGTNIQYPSQRLRLLH